MKKILLFILCCTFINFANAQLTTDTIVKQQKQPWLMPNVGYSLFIGRHFKVGTWIQLSNRVNMEVDYAILIRKPFSFSAHKIFMGLNVFPFNKRNMFFSFSSEIIHIEKQKFYYPYSNNTYYVTIPDYFGEESDNLKMAICAGNKISFSKKKDNCGVLFKYGIMSPLLLGGSELKIPFFFNLECSFYFSFLNHEHEK
jgi:hypothetical protein